MKRTSALLTTVFTLTALCATAQAGRLYRSWTQEYNPTVNESQGAAAVAVDARGNVFTTGFAHHPSGHKQFYTAKYDALDGHLVWNVTYNAGAEAFPNSIVCDGEGNVIVTGRATISSNIDFYTAKYNGTTGALIWSKTYDGTAGGLDEGIKVAVDSNNDVIVTGQSAGSGSAIDIVTIKYAKTNGNPVWAAPDRYTTAGTRDDKPADLAIGTDNSILIGGTANTGSGVFSFYLRKLTSAGALSFDKTLDTGGDGGATAVALNSANRIFATGLFTNASGYHGYYTVHYSSTGSFLWAQTVTPTVDDFTGRPTDIAVGPDGHVVVTGFLEDSGGNHRAYTIKHDTVNNGAKLGDFIDLGFVNQQSGEPFGESRGRQLIIDGANNVVLVGETDNADLDSDIFVTKYDSTLGSRLFFDSFAGSFGSDDTGVGIAADGNGGAAVVGTAFRDFNGGGRTEIVTLKYNRFLAYTGDALPDDTSVPANAVYSTGNAPAVSDNGVAARITMASGKTKLGAIFTQTTAGGTALPAVQKGDAPDITGAKFASFSDPIIAPNGQYAFAAKVTGAPAAQAGGVWTNLGGTLHLALQKGKPVPGMTENLVSVTSLSLVNGQLLALVKVAAPATSNVALVAINAANSGTVIRRTGQAVTVNGVQSTIKKLTVLTPPKTSPGDGRWHGAAATVVKATLADKRTAIFHSTLNPGELVTGGTNFNPKNIGSPAIDVVGSRFAAVLTQNLGGAVTPANDTILIRYSPNSQNYEFIAIEGDAPANGSLNGLTFAAFSDPLIDSTNQALFLATLKGTGVKPTNNKALLYGAGGSHALIARTGSPATDAAGATGTAVWSSITNFALPTGSPIFVAKLAGAGVTAKNNLGIWGRDSSGTVRRILRTGDRLGTQTVKSFTLLKAVSTAPAAARSFSIGGAIAALVKFTDGKQALVKIGLP